jgi:hypothetical protein
MFFKYVRNLRKLFRLKNASADIFAKLNDLGNIPNASMENILRNKNKTYRIAFVIPGIIEFSGGSTSFLRVGTYLSKFGHEIHYITFGKSKVNTMERSARINLENYQGKFRESDALNEKYDIGICTFWVSCYYLLKFKNNFDYKMYFVQDYEPYFYQMGDDYLLAKKTYALGFHIISLGAWNLKKITEFTQSQTHLKFDIIDFPVEPTEYKIINRKISITNEVAIAVYLRFDPRRAPFVLLSQLTYLMQKLTGIKLTINFFGIHKRIRMPIGNNLGQLSKNELINLYSRSHFGIVASLTNISLVNYEMIACGLPVLDLKDGSAPDFFAENEMIFIDIEKDSILNKISYYINNQFELNEIVKNSQKKIAPLSWEKSVKQFAHVIRNL